jgi:DNA-directed RNA polymerase specialized sigma24 family protein
MNECQTTWISQAFVDWLATQENCAVAAARERCGEIASQVSAAVHAVARQVCGHALEADDSRLLPYAKRVWDCIEYHWRRWSTQGPIRWADLMARLRAGDLGLSSYAEARGGRQIVARDLIREVVLAQALGEQEPCAAELFEREYMPIVRAVACRVGGARGLEAVDNFAAELVLPRDARPPRIALFRGRAPLASWLRAVVINYCTSRSRQRDAVTMETLPERPVTDRPSACTDRSECEGLLRPLFTGAVDGVEPEDRLLIKLLVLEEVPQHQVARCLGVHSGNVTRRRQRVTSAIWQAVQQAAARHEQPRRVSECLDLILAGDDRDLRRELGAALADAVRQPAAVDREDHA